MDPHMVLQRYLSSIEKSGFLLYRILVESSDYLSGFQKCTML